MLAINPRSQSIIFQTHPQLDALTSSDPIQEPISTHTSQVPMSPCLILLESHGVSCTGPMSRGLNSDGSAFQKQLVGGHGCHRRPENKIGTTKAEGFAYMLAINPCSQRKLFP